MMGPFCIDDISDIVFFPLQAGMTPHFFLPSVFLLERRETRHLNLHFNALQIHKSATLRVFLSMLYRDMQYLQKKKEEDDYNLKNQCAKSNNAV